MDEDRSRLFSPTKLGTYKNCPRQYKFKYVDRLRAEVASVEALLGTCVHSAFEELYDARLHGRLLDEAATLAVFEREWARGVAKPVAVRDGRFTLDDWRNVGRECVTRYHRAHAPFDEDRTIEVEKRIGFALRVSDAQAGTAEECRIEGFIDRLAVSAKDGFFEIHDYKTGGKLPTQEQKDQDWQLAIYDIAVRRHWPAAPGVRLLWHYVRHGVTLVSRRTPEQLALLETDIAALILAIRSDHAFEPTKSALCDWCDFREECPLFKHREAFAKLPEEERVHEPGVRLVDQLGALETSKKALRKEIADIEKGQERLEAELLRYCERHGVDVVAGTEFEAERHRRTDWRFPTRTAAPDKVAAMEGELRGTPLWPAVSRLDPKAAAQLRRCEELPDGSRRLVEEWLERWGREETTESIRLKRRPEPEQ